MRRAFAHEATVLLAPGSDAHGPGAAITAELCGSWDHAPPCPLAAHHTAAESSGQRLRLRILFATEPAREHDVRRRIRQALEAGAMSGPSGVSTRWTFCGGGASEVRPEEAGHALRLIRT